MQPTVSRIIQALEEELGAPLLRRENRRKKRQVQPITTGEEVYRHVLNLLHERDLLLVRIDGYRHVKDETLRLGLALFGSDLLSHVPPDSHQKRPDIELSFLEQGSPAIEQSSRDNKLDVGQLLAPVHEGFDSITLCDYPLVVLMPKGWAKHDALTLRNLQHEPFILFGAGLSLNETIQTVCRSQGFTPNVVYRIGQWNLATDTVTHNMGIALLPEYYARKINPGVFTVIPLVESKIRWQLIMAWKKHQRPTSTLKAWLDVVREMFGRRGK